VRGWRWWLFFDWDCHIAELQGRLDEVFPCLVTPCSLDGALTVPSCARAVLPSFLAWAIEAALFPFPERSVCDVEVELYCPVYFPFSRPLRFRGYIQGSCRPVYRPNRTACAAMPMSMQSQHPRL
jgi:hypothetical protein